MASRPIGRDIVSADDVEEPARESTGSVMYSTPPDDGHTPIIHSISTLRRGTGLTITRPSAGSTGPTPTKNVPQFTSSKTPTDFSWQLKITITDIPTDAQQNVSQLSAGKHPQPSSQQKYAVITVTVFKHTSIGELIRHIVNRLTSQYALDKQHHWDDYEFWSRSRNEWLDKHHWVLKKYEINVTTEDLLLTPKHKFLQVQLPDLQRLPVFVNFMSPVLMVVKDLCHLFSITEFDEMSLRRLKSEVAVPSKPQVQSDQGDSVASVDGSAPVTPIYVEEALPNSPFTPGGQTYKRLRNRSGRSDAAGTSSVSSMDQLDRSFDGDSSVISKERFEHSQHKPNPTGFRTLVYFKDNKHLTSDSIYWLDSHLSLMQQGIKSRDVVSLQFKYYSDSTPASHDMVRLNQLYQQIRYGVVSNKFTCSADEAAMFAALQLQVELKQNQSSVMRGRMASGNSQSSREGLGANSLNGSVEDLLRDLDDDLNNVPTLEPGQNSQKLVMPMNNAFAADHRAIPHEKQELEYIIPRKEDKRGMLANVQKAFSMNSGSKKRKFKVGLWGIVDCHLIEFKNRKPESKPVRRHSLLGCEITPKVDIMSDEYEMTLHLVNGENEDIDFRFQTESVYLNWKSAFKVASNGNTMASAEFDKELARARKMHMLLRPNTGVKNSPIGDLESRTTALQQFSLSLPRNLVESIDFTNPEHSHNWRNRIMATHANVRSFTLAKAKQAYIDTWRTLPRHGYTYFLIHQCYEEQKKNSAKPNVQQSADKPGGLQINGTDSKSSISPQQSTTSLKSDSNTSFENLEGDSKNDPLAEYYHPPPNDNNSLEIFKIGQKSFAVCDLKGVAKRVFHYSQLVSWTINRKKRVNSVRLKLKSSSDNYSIYVNFHCVGYPARLIQEFIGGYVYIQLKQTRPEDATENVLKKLVFNKQTP